MLGIGKKLPAFNLTGVVSNDANHARLCMNVIGSPGISKCVTARERILRQHDVGRETVQSTVRIAAVMHAVAGVLDYETARAA
jgi:hypothetical protein